MKVINLSDKKVSLELSVEEFNKLQETEKRIQDLEEALNKEKDSKSLFVTTNMSFLRVNIPYFDDLDRFNSLMVSMGDTVKETAFGKELYILRDELHTLVDKRDKLKSETDLNLRKLSRVPKLIKKLFKINEF